MATTTKKELRSEIEQKMATTFDGLKDSVSSKKFNRNIKKASKVLLSGIKPASEKKTAKKNKMEIKSALLPDKMKAS